MVLSLLTSSLQVHNSHWIEEFKGKKFFLLLLFPDALGYIFPQIEELINLSLYV